MKLSQARTRKKARLEIIPLIDIMFFLVATFMMVSLSMIKNEGVEVNLPVASSSVQIERSESATISLNNEGQLFFNKDEVSLDELRTRVTEFRLTSPNGPILMNCDKESTMDNYIEVLDTLRIIGITNVSLQTRTPGE